MGPIQIFLFGFEDFAATGAIATELEALSSAGIVRVLDARFMVKDTEGNVILARATELDEFEREDLRAAAGALIGLGAGAVLGGEEGAEAGFVLGAEAAMAGGELGFSAEQVVALGSEMEAGDALLLLVLEHIWAAGLRDSLRFAGLTYAEQNYLTPEGLIALGVMLGVEAAVTA